MLRTSQWGNYIYLYQPNSSKWCQLCVFKILQAINTEYMNARWKNKTTRRMVRMCDFPVRAPLGVEGRVPSPADSVNTGRLEGSCCCMFKFSCKKRSNTGIPWGHCEFGSRSPEFKANRAIESVKWVFWFPSGCKSLFTLYCSPLSVQGPMSKKNQHVYLNWKMLHC